MAEGVLERVVQHGGAHVEEGLHRGPAPAHLLLLVHALGDDLVDRALHERGWAWFKTGSHVKPGWRCQEG